MAASGSDRNAPRAAQPERKVPFVAAKNWTSCQLRDLQVTFTQLSVSEFFGCDVDDLPQPDWAYLHLTGILNSESSFDCKDQDSHTFINLVEHCGIDAPRANVALLARKIMEHLNYQRVGQTEGFSAFIDQQPKLNFQMAGEEPVAIPEVTLVHMKEANLCIFVQANGRLAKGKHWITVFPHAQAMAQSMGVYSANSITVQWPSNLDKRSTELSDHAYLGMAIPSFTLLATILCFYVIPITPAFASAVAEGISPPHALRAYYCAPPMKKPVHEAGGGMIDLEQRCTIMKTFEAFKRLIATKLHRYADQSLPESINPKRYPENVWHRIQREMLEYQEQMGQGYKGEPIKVGQSLMNKGDEGDEQAVPPRRSRRKKRDEGDEQAVPPKRSRRKK